MMFYKYIVLTLVLCGNLYEVSTHCVNSHAGKTTCVTQDLLEMLIGLNKRHYKEPKDRPMFHAFLKNDITFSGENILKFDDVTINIGNHYKSGVFATPRKGIYQFSCVIMAGGGTNTVIYQLNINNNLFAYGYTSRTSHGASNTNIWIVELNKGDRVYIRHRQNVPEKVAGDRSTYFNGLLLQYMSK